jgi:hypothetical protein
MMLARIGAGTSFRDWLKAAWITFMVLFCIRACFFFVSLGNSGITITRIFIAGMGVMIWYNLDPAHSVVLATHGSPCLSVCG